MNESHPDGGGRGRLRALDKLGWPVVLFRWRKRPITNVIRLLLHTRRIARWTPPTYAPSTDNQCAVPNENKP